MNKETKEKNRSAGRFNLIESVEYYRRNGKLLEYIGNHVGIMANIYDYIRFTRSIEDWTNRIDKAEEILKDHYAFLFLNNRDMSAKETYINWHICKDGLKDMLKEICKSLIASEYVKRIAESRECVEDL